MRMRVVAWLMWLSVGSSCFVLQAEEKPTFRTDASADASVPWYLVEPGVFPPEGSAHYFAGELIQVDHLNRKFVLRVDRTDAQNRSHWDLPVAASMLPYGSIYYHGAPAALEDIPLGTHLHGAFYVKDPQDKTKPLEGWNNRRSTEGDFRRCFRIEDDFSYDVREKRQWRIDEVNAAEKKLLATPVVNGEPAGDAKKFDLSPVTRVWKRDSVVSQNELTPGTLMQMNITWATLYGPGRVREIWLDEEAQRLATAQQREKHLLYIRERGIPGWVNEVDNQERIVTVTLFGGLDSTLYDALVPGESAALAVADDTLQMYDPVNDRKRGPILSLQQVTVEPGSSGVKVQVQTDLLLEGFRPKHIVRVYPGSWPVIALPQEEQLFGR